MKRFTIVSFVTLALLVTWSISAPTAYAADCTYETLGQSCPLSGGGTGVCRQNNDDEGSVYCAVSQAGMCAAGQACTTSSGAAGTCVASEFGNECVAGLAPGTVTDPAAAKTPTSDTSASMMGALDKGVAWVLNLVAKLFAWLLGVSIILLDNVVYWTVVKMGAYVNDLAAVGVTWSILRDIGNIILIFGFLAIGISTILNTERFGWKTKMLPMMLISAIFLNFSLFFAEAIVDTGNLFATQFYTQINGGQPATAREFSLSNISNDGISNKIMAQLGLQSIYGAALQNDEVLKEGTSTVIAFMSILLFITAAFVMFALSFILLARFVILLFLIITAPVGFAGLAIPQLSGIAQKWWHTLFNQTLVAPVLLLLLYIALTVITDANFLAFGKPPQWLGLVAAKGNIDIAGFGAAILAFLIAMGLLLAVIIAATKMSAFGAGWATGLAGKLSFGTVGFAGRYTVGLGANRLAKVARKSKLARIPLVGTGLVKGLEGVAGSSFDMRGGQVGGGLKSIGVSAGEAQKGGYKEALKKGIEKRTKYASELKGKSFEDLKPEEQGKLATLQNELRTLEKERNNARSADEYIDANTRVKEKETEIEEFHKATGTETGNKLKYAGVLGHWLPSKLASNREAAKKIKEEAKKSKDDKDLDTLRKALKKGGGDEDAGGAAPAAGGGGAAPAGGGAPPGGGGHP